MARLSLSERRTFLFTPALLLDACLAFDREHNGRIWKAADPALIIGAEHDGRVSLTARPVGSESAETAERSAAWVAAALLHYCFAHRIPIPRHAQKRIVVTEQGLHFVIEMATPILAAQAQVPAPPVAIVGEPSGNPSQRDEATSPIATSES